MDHRFWYFACGCVLTLIVASPSVQAVQLTQTTDSSLIVNGTVYRIPDSTGPDIGFWSNPVVAVYVFKLPAETVGEAVASASFQIQAWQVNYGDGGGISFNGDLYGLPGNKSPTVTVSDFYAGAFGGDPYSWPIEGGLLTPAISATYAVPTVVSTSIDANVLLTQYVNDAYVQVGAGGYLFLRVNPNMATSGVFSAGYAGPFYENFNSSNDTFDELYPTTLSLTFTPEPGTLVIWEPSFSWGSYRDEKGFCWRSGVYWPKLCR